MNIKYRFISTITLLLFGYLIHSQEFYIRTGFNLSNQLLKNDNVNYSDLQNYKMLLTGHLGLAFENSMSKKFSYETGLYFNTKGYKYSESNGEDEISQRFYLFYAEIPFHVKFSINIDKDKLFVLAGPYASYGLFGKRFSKTTVSGDKTKDVFSYNFGDKDLSNHFIHFDAGVDGGIGYYKAPLLLQVTYSYGILNISQDSGDGVVVKNNGISVSVGLQIGRNNKSLFEDFLD